MATAITTLPLLDSFSLHTQRRRFSPLMFFSNHHCRPLPHSANPPPPTLLKALATYRRHQRRPAKPSRRDGDQRSNSPYLKSVKGSSNSDIDHRFDSQNVGVANVSKDLDDEKRTGVYYRRSKFVDLMSLCRDGKVEEAVEYVERGVDADGVTFAAILDAINGPEMLQLGKRVDALMRKSSLIVRDVEFGNRVIQLYVRCGSMVDARKVFDEMLVRSLSYHGLQPPSL